MDTIRFGAVNTILAAVLLLTALWIPGKTIMPSAAFAADHLSQEALDGFEDGFEQDGADPFDSIDTDLPEQTAANETDTGPVSINGFLETTLEYGFNRDNEKLSRLAPLLFLESEYRINPDVKAKVSAEIAHDFSYEIEAKDLNRPYNQDDARTSVQLKDFLIDARLSDVFSLRAGRQITAWGASDYAKITDVVNPRDLTSPGLIDLEDARLPVASFRLTAQKGSWRFDAVTVHEHPGSKISGLGRDFDYFKSLRSPLVIIDEKDAPGPDLENTGFALKVTRSYNGGDITFIGASAYDDTPYLRYEGLNTGRMTFTPVYDRVTTLGISSTLARGSALYKAETALTLDRAVLRNDIATQVLSGLPKSRIKTVNHEDRINSLIGVEYTGFSDLRLNLETQMTYTPNAGKELSVDETEFITYFQATKDLMNERLELDLFWVTTHPGSGSILRLSGTYDLFDDFEIETGVIFYDADNAEADLYVFKDQDRVYMQIKYSF